MPHMKMRFFLLTIIISCLVLIHSNPKLKDTKQRTFQEAKDSIELKNKSDKSSSITLRLETLYSLLNKLAIISNVYKPIVYFIISLLLIVLIRSIYLNYSFSIDNPNFTKKLKGRITKQINMSNYDIFNNPIKNEYNKPLGNFQKNESMKQNIIIEDNTLETRYINKYCTNNTFISKRNGQACYHNKLDDDNKGLLEYINLCNSLPPISNDTLSNHIQASSSDIMNSIVKTENNNVLDVNGKICVDEIITVEEGSKKEKNESEITLNRLRGRNLLSQTIMSKCMGK
jgi:hypothetical protein